MNSAEPPSRPKIWLQACRINSLAISSIGVFTGTAVAVWENHFSLLPFLLAWLGSVAIQGGTNLTNVYFNYKATSATADPALFDPRGSTSVLRLGLLQPAEVRRAGLLLFGLGIVCGLTLVALSGATILWLGLPAVAAGYCYAGPPVRYGHLALGVVSVFFFMGPVMVCGAYFVQSGAFSWNSLAVALPIGLLAAGIMHTNDLRDYETDLAHGKRTLATLLGKDRSATLLAAMDLLAFAIPAGATALGLLPWLTLLFLLAVPAALRQVRMLRAADVRQLHQVWLGGVKLHTQFGVALIAGLLLSRLTRI